MNDDAPEPTRAGAQIAVNHAKPQSSAGTHRNSASASARPTDSVEPDMTRQHISDYIRVVNTLKANAGLASIRGQSIDPETVARDSLLGKAIQNFKTARARLRAPLTADEPPESDADTNKALLGHIRIGVAEMKDNLAKAALPTGATGADNAQTASVKSPNEKVPAAVKPNSNAAIVQYTPKKGEGVMQIAAQQPKLVDLAKDTLCGEETDERSAALVAAIAIARHNPVVKRVDVIPQGVPLAIPTEDQFKTYLRPLHNEALALCG